ncbi:MAG TPA: NAD(P)H-hydrate dehydratase [Polyangiaceae bacterium]|nr:NAD(P)H-hydrate dehydratase [Polyangiaceae bacterium]
MTPVLTRAEVRELDRRATAEAEVPSLELMENAGHGATELALARYPEARRVVIVCGTGNNGGDGFVVARLLKTHGREARVLVAGDAGKLRGDALANSRAWIDAGGSLATIDEGSLDALTPALEEADLVVDGLFGTGLDRELTGLARGVVERIVAARKPTLALDLPSGLDADTGAALGVAVRADVTATFARKKRGLCTPAGAEYAGDVVVVPIGIPPAIEQSVGYGAAELEPADVAAAIRPRGARSHKGSSGRVLVLAGSPGKIGAALLVSRGALRAGAGLVTLGGEPPTAAVFEQRVLEAMTTRLDPDAPERSLEPLLERTDTVVVGPGLGVGAFARRVVDHVALGWRGRAVVDADALTAFAGRAEALAKAPGELVLTPHPGELARLLGRSTEAVEADRFGAAREAVERTGRVVLLKGAFTLIAAPGRAIAVNPTGNGLLATGGAGDVLAGVIGALSVGAEPYAAACAGAYVHGAAADLLAADLAVDRGVLAHEVADAVPRAIWAVRHH